MDSRPRSPRRHAAIPVAVALLALALVAPLADAGTRRAGSLDPSFGTAGRVVTVFPGTRSAASASRVARQADGRLVVAGEAEAGGGQQFAIARYLPNGRLDPSFGGDGRVTINGGTASAVAIQRDGRIVVAGTAGDGYAIARLTRAGRLDTTFGTGGTTSVEFSDPAGANAVTIDAAGRIVLAGSLSTGPFASSFSFARLRSDGSLDRTFSGDGRVAVQLGSPQDNGLANAVTITPGGRILAVGVLNDAIAGGGAFALVRLRANGTPDPGFSGDGTVTTEVGSEGGAVDLAIDARGRIVTAGGATDTPSTEDFVLIRYSPNGARDGSFGSGGIVRTELPGRDAFAAGVAIDAAGRIIAVGQQQTSSSSSVFAVVRYRSGGSLDPRFGTAGRVATRFAGAALAQANDVVIEPSGRIVAVGGGGPGFLLAGYRGSAIVPITGRSGG